MKPAAALDKTARLLESVNETTGRALSWLTLAMVLITATVVLLRYAFDTGWIALQESVNYMHAAVFMLGAAYAYRHGAHVRVDIFYSGFSARRKAAVDLAGNLLLLLPVCVFLVWISAGYVAQSWRIRETSLETGGLPFVYLLKTGIPLAAVLLAIQAVADSFRQILTLLHPDGETRRSGGGGL